MKKLLLIAFLSVSVVAANAQTSGFAYGEVNLSDLKMTMYPRDSTAEAVVIRESGDAYIDLSTMNKVIVDYHVVIKILKNEGLEQANYEIPLWKYQGDEEILRSVRATSYNLSGSVIVPTQLEMRNVFTDKVENNRFTRKKFAVPNVQVGSVIEIQYTLESPWLFNFRTWTFQDDIPKMKSEFWATYPANYEYNITLRGYQALNKNESKVIKSCVGSTAGYGAATGADCVQLQYAMTNIPAFKEEEYMTAKSNFISAIYFELSVVRYFDGKVKKYTREWKDVDLELRREEEFGSQIRKARDVMKEEVLSITTGVLDPLEKAKKIYKHIQTTVSWNDKFGILTDVGVKKAYETKKGSVADINLLLVGALQAAELDVQPVLLSTRAHGLPIEIHPVLTSFNYVIAQVTIGTQTYLLDATDPLLIFSMLPERCINGKGRVMPNKDSYWIELKPTHKHRETFVVSLKLEKDGSIAGTMQTNYSGYAAMAMRKRILSFTDRSEYIDELKKALGDEAEVSDYEVKDLENFEVPLIETFKIKSKAFDGLDQVPLLFDPFLVEKRESNPFKSRQRTYPVDFGVPFEEVVVFSLEYPPTLLVSELPPPVAISLPNAGGRYLQEVQNPGNKISLTSSLVIGKTVYTSAEYHFLRELYNRMIAAQNTNVVFEKIKP